MSDRIIAPGTRARVRLRDDLPVHSYRPHHPAEDGVRVEVAALDEAGYDSGVAPYKGGGWPPGSDSRCEAYRPSRPVGAPHVAGEGRALFAAEQAARHGADGP